MYNSQQYKTPAFPYINFEISKVEGKKEYFVIESTTQLRLPGNSTSKNSFKKVTDAAEWINNNFGLTDQQVEHNKTKGMLSPGSLAWNFSKVNNIDLYELIPAKYNNIDIPETDYTGYFNRFEKLYSKYPLDKNIMIQATEQGYFNHLSDDLSISRMINSAYETILV